ncbi:MAG: PEP/pyruvate-binding domain-containing protein [bacterium]|nr:PEP/pyruvate-binding domain-containing protein [bacterium]
MSTKETIFIKNFSKITKKSVFEAGGKGASLGEMTNSKIPVPPGFVLLAPAFDRFLEETDLTQELGAMLDRVNYKDINSVDGASAEIRNLISRAAMPADLQKDIVTEFKKLKAKFVAVRSSATAEDSSSASWAGELETYLNTTEKTLLLNVKKCWSSLFTPRAIFYRHEKKLLKTKVSVAVVVQEMVDSEISGIAFTVHPVTKDKNQMIIEAGYGLGEAIVSGSITPDSYVLDKRDYSLIDINVAVQEKQIVKGAAGGTKWTLVAKSARTKQKLNGRQIVALAQICAGIEKHYKFPCDIEWAYKQGKFFITQSRPITTL